MDFDFHGFDAARGAALAAAYARDGYAVVRGLLNAVEAARLGAAADAGAGMLREIPGLVPPLGRRPAICAFADRCGRADATCLDNPQPPLAEAGPARAVACWHPEDRAA